MLAGENTRVIDTIPSATALDKTGKSSDESASLSSKSESKDPIVSHDICRVLQKYPKWYAAAVLTEKRWGLPVDVQLAIIRHESSFDGNARPLRKVKKGFSYAYEQASSAYGYAQAKTLTWKDYKDATKRKSARRDRFADAVDFIGWYNHRSHRSLGLKKQDAFRLYLAYHEGHRGFEKRSYRKKPWLIKVAKRVAESSKRYKKQLRSCKKKVLKKLASSQ